jgi:arogenate dehydrogenase (NADP+)
MPVLVSAALLEAAGGESDAATARLARQLASSGFADTSRIGGGNPALGTLMARSNRDAVLAALGHYRQQIETLEQLVRQQQWEALEQRLSRCQQLRPEFLPPAAATEPPGPPAADGRR